MVSCRVRGRAVSEKVAREVLIQGFILIDENSLCKSMLYKTPVSK